MVTILSYIPREPYVETVTNKVSEKEREELELYAISAVLMDGDSGRVLYEKNGDEIRAMASTTKIMTLIVALENADLEDEVIVSKKASIQPDVQLGIREGEKYRLGDLLYSLMLESHNDTAVAIAEHVAGSVENFAQLMNEKALDIGCYDTHFITPNGLDAEENVEISSEKGGKEVIKIKHSTTAKDLARIMKYCIVQSPKSEDFLNITRTDNYTFSCISNGGRSYSCNNHNAFLSMMEGALSGKTGFTGDAGYCYVGSLKRDDRTYIVALLGCGWPNNKSYKWSDTKTLMNYGLDNYNYVYYKDIPVDDSILEPICVKNGQTMYIDEKVYEKLKIEDDRIENDKILLNSNEKIEVVYDIPKSLEAPIYSGKTIGRIDYKVEGEVVKTKNIVTKNTIYKINYIWCLDKIYSRYFLEN